MESKLAPSTLEKTNETLERDSSIYIYSERRTGNFEIPSSNSYVTEENNVVKSQLQTDNSCYELLTSCHAKDIYSLTSDKSADKEAQNISIISHKRKLSRMKADVTSEDNFVSLLEDHCEQSKKTVNVFEHESNVEDELAFQRRPRNEFRIYKTDFNPDFTEKCSPYIQHQTSLNHENKKYNFCNTSSDSNKSFSDLQSSPVSSSYLSINPSSMSFKCKESSNVCDSSDHKKRSYPFETFSPVSSISATHRSSLSPFNSQEKRIYARYNKRNSFPFTKSSPIAYFNSRQCATDQTPYETEELLQKRKRPRLSLPYYDHYGILTVSSDSGFIDSHCHLDFLFQRQDYSGTYSEYQAKYKDTYPKSYRGCVAVFCNPFTFNKTSMWEKFLEENVWASFGCHPHNAKDYNDSIEEALHTAIKHPKVRAVGEIGLDYSNRNNCLKEVQHETFRRQLKIVIKTKLPVIIHCREAHKDGMKIVKEILPNDYTIHLHCFTDKWDIAQEWLTEFPNLYIGLTNVVTFPSAEAVHEVARQIPLERLLLETDAPYFVPRKIARETKFSHPGMALHVAAQVASIKNVALEKVLCATRENTRRVYKI